ncbi:MAG: cytochrome b/b6 domain-containing protein [candidate division Zixibacteria bacterium]|nr:cytochrome b/b6 domain-containing protein [candidate division Zixibacteria bacterium]MDH3936185.1 cytochrome b/b6 domain-containing protein [candidate division Zixibacteria bacterium]MDH4032971.1 cytochrome b/b6 domain-containing protein [candidate division Zixibacteria bacterium]
MIRTHNIGFWSALLVLLICVGVPVRAQEDVGDGTTACLDCHDVTEDNGDHAFDVALNGSVHEGFSCTDCHLDIEQLPHEETPGSVPCGDCHSDVSETYMWHGRLKTESGVDIPGCANCHGRHDILASSEKQSRVNPINLPYTCGKCHENLDMTEKHVTLYDQAVQTYQSSVHGKTEIGGIYSAATCVDCHSPGGSSHHILAANHLESSVNHFNIPKTCGKCHQRIERDFWDGIHGQLVLQGDNDSPVCTHCHGEHGIIASSDPRSPVSPDRIAEATCSPCHESAALNEKYEIPTGEEVSYVDSYHGLKSQAGDQSVANCASCHGGHRILDHSDPTSSIHADNLEETCGNCHPEISAEIAQTPIHGDPGLEDNRLANIVKDIYIWLILLVIGGMLLHWLIDLRKEIQKVSKGPQLVRMTRSEVWQHTFLTVSFISLVVSGFALRYSDSTWVHLLFGWEGGFELRGTIHRISAVMLIVTTVWHLLYLMTARGRGFLRDMIPTMTDLRQAIQLIGYNLGLAKDKPRFGRFAYIEKAEYWALVWGTVVMVATGLLLWFDNFFIGWLSKSYLDVALVVHFYEAWLATLAIMVWHLYATVFNPGTYPMNPAWYSGKMPVDKYRHEHPEDPIILELDRENMASRDSVGESKDDRVRKERAADT